MDDTELNPGVGGDKVRDIEKAPGVKTQVVVLDYGGAGAEQLLGQKPATDAGLVSIDARLLTLNTNIDVALSSRNAEVTQLLIKAKTDNLDVLLSTVAQQATLALIKAKTDNLDVGLSTRALELGGNLAGINAKTPALGQAVMAASSPVAIASDQSAIPVTVATLPAPTGAALEAGNFYNVQVTLLRAILDQLSVMNRQLNSGLNVRDDLDALLAEAATLTSQSLQ